jgi:hypothetical protein
MIVFSWFPINYYKLSFGKQDQLSVFIKELKNHFEILKDDIKEEDLLSFLNLNREHLIVKSIIKKLTKYVPFRFVRPWYDETIGMNDAIVNQNIIILQKLKKHNTPYHIDLSNNEIHLDLNWYDWIFSNLKIIESFTLFELFKYVEKNNPYVTNISLKLFKPQLRKLSEPTKLWKNYIEIKGAETKSVFENKLLINLNNLAIDHYLPWSLVTHDKLWNLHPIEQEVNSSKSNKIAESSFLKFFTNIQFSFMHHVSSLNTKYLEDYYDLFSISQMELLGISNDRFTEILSAKISIETDLANNLGYYTKWSYSSHD